MKLIKVDLYPTDISKKAYDIWLNNEYQIYQDSFLGIYFVSEYQNATPKKLGNIVNVEQWLLNRED